MFPRKWYKFIPIKSPCSLCKSKEEKAAVVLCNQCKRKVCEHCVGCLSNVPSEDLLVPICQFCYFAKIDFNVYFDVDKIEGSDYIEIGPGKHDYTYWSKESIFIRGESFLVITGIIEIFVEKYDHFGANDISRKRIIEMVRYFEVLREQDAEVLQKAINLNDTIFNSYKEDIIKMIEGIFNSMLQFCEKEEWVKIIGV